MLVDISIIIPLYNKENYIERTLRSVYLQDIDNWECIIVDDGSTDSSLAKACAFIDLNPGNWKIVTQPNSGQTSARNHGVDLAKGSYLAFLDADDLWPKNKLRLQYTALAEHPRAVLVLSAFAIFRDHLSDPRVVRHRNPNKMNKRWLSMSGFGGGLESVGMIRRDALLGKVVFDPTLSTSSGLDLSLRLAKLGEIILLPSIGLFYRINPGQWHANTNELSKNLDILCRRYQDSFNDNLTKSHSAYLFWISAREHGNGFLALSLLQALIHTGNGRLFLITNLIARNIASTFRGRAIRNEILPTLQLLDR